MGFVLAAPRIEHVRVPQPRMALPPTGYVKASA
jgi:hypothetical protein